MHKGNSGVIYTAIICLGLIGLIIWMFVNVMQSPKEVKERTDISVILYYTENNGWESLQEGMKQAEEDFDVNINYVILRENATGAEQVAAIDKEMKNGAEGILLAVCDYEAVSPSLMQNVFRIPIITVESGLNNEIYPLMSADNYAMGKRLGEEILKDFEGKEAPLIALLEDGKKRDSLNLRKQGLQDAIKGKARLIAVKDIGKESVDVVVALHKDTLLKATESEAEFLEEAAVYGIGNTSSTVAALDQGKIKKLVFQNEFNVGYLGVKELLSATETALSAETPEIDFYCVSREELYGTQYEQLLFPIVE